MKWVADANALQPGRMLRAETAREAICVVRTATGEYYALEDACTHEGAPLSDGDLTDFEVECPLHFSRFDVRTGKVVGQPATQDARTFRVTVSDGGIWIDA